MIGVSQIQNHALWSVVFCIDLSVCSFAKAPQHSPISPNHIQGSNKWLGASKKIPFLYVFHCCVNVATRCCHSERSRPAPAPNRLPWLVVNLFSWREIDRQKIALSDFTLHSLQLFFHSSTLRHAWDRQRLYPLAAGVAGGWADWGGMEEEMGVGRQSYIWALWGKINHVIISEKYGWISSAGSCPVHAAGFLTGLSLRLAFSMTLKSKTGEDFENTLIGGIVQHFQSYIFPLCLLHSGGNLKWFHLTKW